MLDFEAEIVRKLGYFVGVEEKSLPRILAVEFYQKSRNVKRFLYKESLEPLSEYKF